MKVVFAPKALEQFDELPLAIRARVTAIIARLASWPNVSGAKPLRGGRKGEYRIRTGDYRVVFVVKGDIILIQIEHRSTVYD